MRRLVDLECEDCGLVVEELVEEVLPACSACGGEVVILPAVPRTDFKFADRKSPLTR